MADAGNEQVGVDIAGLGGELPVLVSGDRVLLHYRLEAQVVGEASAVGIPVGLVQHGICGVQEPTPGDHGF